MSPENLIECTKLYDFYTNSFDDGKFNHKAHIYLPEIKSTTSNSEATTPATYSAPTLMDLVNEENILPADINVERLEAEWFEQSDPYDLAETDRMTTPDDANIVRCSTRWNVGDAVKLDSRLLASLIKHLGGDRSVLIVGGHVVNASSSAMAGPSGTPDDS
ncbi:hypothetical protein JOM56_012776 [Amanita muscaria]